MQIQERKDKEKKFKQDRIVDAAERIFFSKGINNITMFDIAKEAGYQKRTLYTHFKTKEEIYFIIIRRAHEMLGKTMAEEFMSVMKESGWVKLLTLGKAIVKFATLHPDQFKAIAMFRVMENNKAVDRKREIISENLEKLKDPGNTMLEMILKVIQAGKADGSLRPDVDPVNAAIILYINVIGAGTLIQKDGFDFIGTYRSWPAIIEDVVRYNLRSLSEQPIPDNLI
jgi:AcrR family transcriptional regulator